MLKVIISGRHRAARETLARALGRQGAEATTEARPKRFATHWSTSPPDAILLDMDPADAACRDLLGEVRKAMASTPLIAITDNVSLDARLQAMRVGIDDYIQKPCSVEALLKRIQAVVEGCRHRCHLLARQECEAARRLLASLSCRLQGPVDAITHYGALLPMSDGMPSDVCACLEYVVREGTKLARVAEELRRLSSDAPVATDGVGAMLAQFAGQGDSTNTSARTLAAADHATWPATS